MHYQPPHMRLSPAEVEEKRVNGLCFLCYEKFTFNHKCANRRLYSVVLEPRIEGDEVEENNKETPSEEKNLVLSLHALHRVDMAFNNQTMKLMGYYKKKRIEHIS